MDFEVDLDLEMEPLVVSQGAASFRLKHQPMTSRERMTAIELLSANSVMAYEVLMGKVTGWEGVKRKGGGDQPFTLKRSDGVEMHYLDQVMARVDYPEQLKTMFRMLAMNGARFPRTGEVLGEYLDAPALKAFLAELDDFLARRRGGPTTPSTN